MPAMPRPHTSRRRTASPAARAPASRSRVSAREAAARPNAAPAPARLLPLPLVEQLLGAPSARGAEFAEVYVDRTPTAAVSLDEGKIRSAQVGSVTGVGIRAIRGAQVGYAYSDDLDETALLRTAQTAALIADGTREVSPQAVSRRPLPQHYPANTPPPPPAAPPNIPPPPPP